MGLVWHAASYLIVNVFLWAIWLIIGLSDRPAVAGPLAHLGDAGVGHRPGLPRLRLLYRPRGESRREDQIQKEMERLRNQK